ncbi:hypothetical protein ACFWY9_33435 [Amycolatopsis sp. NPDC059027]
MAGERSTPTPIFDSLLTETGLDWPDPAKSGSSEPADGEENPER